MLSVHKLTKSYGNRFALDELSFQMRQGEVLFVTGHSGAGKSTLLRLLGLMDRPTSGEIYFHGEPVSQLTPSQMPLYRRQLGMVFQDHQLLMDRNIFDNVALPLAITGAHFKYIEQRVRRVLGLVGLSGRETYFPHELSTGEQQRVGIARALVHKPQLLLADEPTGNLDPDLSLDIMSLFQEFASLGVGVVIATHDITLVGKYAKRLLHLKRGHLYNEENNAHQMGVLMS
ncbi:MAG TPA: cell division ATP-binding protein FtsE [Gammaproteobacteria bacterium]|mgnify:CR=1|nr:cell division ATP-binding protein FtsE [Gammaproteobacteria bacterium]MEC8012135.1 cell division ATP-binding protein FtsE [Pseudomonadota bacterium]HBF07380.1 cell division ATP-binding protein FtsE [Gammaproteobacteria bacterium]HCK94159.1 cell division ATP-binding protein FtsE [Gammaproteobacteria bacterium]|tara:strand:+ start:1945 stop:2634 length:690 start_codon:yes stop_codon:yes gene_type:complete